METPKFNRTLPLLSFYCGIGNEISDCKMGFFFFVFFCFCVCVCDKNGLRYQNEDAIIGCPCLFFSLLKNRVSLMEKDCSFSFSFCHTLLSILNNVWYDCIAKGLI